MNPCQLCQAGGSYIEMNRRASASGAMSDDDSVSYVESPVETIEVQSNSSLSSTYDDDDADDGDEEYFEVIDRQMMTDRPIKSEGSAEFRNTFARVWCETEPRTILCCDALEIFKNRYIRRHKRLQMNVEERVTTMWNRMTHEQRLPFETEAFVARYICCGGSGGSSDHDVGQNFEEETDQFFKHLSRRKMYD